MFRGHLAKLGDGPGCQLPDPFFRDAHRGTHLPEGHRFATGIQSIAIADDPSFAVVELFQQLGDLAFPLDLGRFFGLLVGPLVRHSLEHVRPRVAEPGVVAVLS